MLISFSVAPLSDTVMMQFSSTMTLSKFSLYHEPIDFSTLKSLYFSASNNKYFSTYSVLSIDLSASKVDGIITDSLFSPPANVIQLFFS